MDLVLVLSVLTASCMLQARINFLRELQDKHDEYETAYQSELKALQAKYNALYGK